MRSVLIYAALASSVVAFAWPSSARAQEEEQPGEEEPAPPPETYEPPQAPAPPPPPPARPRVRRAAPPQAPPTVVVTPAPRRDVMTWTEETPDTGLIGAGLMMFGLSYGTSIVVGATSDRASDLNLLVPVAGPFMDLANRGDCNGPCGPDETVNRALIASAGIFQAAGVLQILGGFLFPTTVTHTAAVPTGVHFAPKIGKGMVGLSAYGSF